MLLGVSLVGMRAWWSSQLFHSPTDLALVAALGLTMLCSFSIVFRRPWLRAARWVMLLSSVVGGVVVMADALNRTPSPIHALMMLVPALGALGAMLRDKTT